MNPLIPESVVQDAIERDPESAKSEWLGEFRDDLSALITDAALRACVPSGRGLLEPSTEHEYMIVVDNATGSAQDSLAMALGHLEVRDGAPVNVVDGVAEAKPPFDPSQAVVQIAGYAHEYGVPNVFGDRVGQGWCEPIYAQVGLRYEPLRMTKTELYLAGLALINSRQIELPDEPRLLNQIMGLQRRPMGGASPWITGRARTRTTIWRTWRSGWPRSCSGAGAGAGASVDGVVVTGPRAESDRRRR